MDATISVFDAERVMARENTTPQSALQWLALQYVSGEMTEGQAAGFEEQLAEDEAACEAVASAVQTSLTIRQAFEIPVEETSPVRETPTETHVTCPAPSHTTTSRGARWISVVVSAVAVIIVLVVTQNHEQETVTDNNRELAVLWTQASEMLPVDLMEAPLEDETANVDEEAIVGPGNDRLPPVDLVDVPEWLLVGLESQEGQPGIDDDILLEN